MLPEEISGPEDDESIVRQKLPGGLPAAVRLNFKYHRDTDTLDILTGSQDRWASRTIETGTETVYLDSNDVPIRVAIHAASETFSLAWLRKHDRRRKWERRHW